MAQIPKRLTTEQKTILDFVATSDALTSQFYFTGGTALSSFYLDHRESEDLDFFSQQPFSQELIDSTLAPLLQTQDIRVKTEFIDPLYRFRMLFPTKTEVKVDFSHYTYPRVSQSLTYQKITIDGLLDIAVNKLQSITSRHAVKDYVDLYFLLKQFTFWDLREGMRIKFRNDLEPIIIASDFLAVEDFAFLPKMHKPLTLDELKTFFRTEAVKLGRTAVE